ncbi:hypothetical protein CFC21_030948 [Triticum aestivum]|uniref:Arp2/3 complex 34 kDa subunit n=2 Tax=Triticum aestivum TaxID=4565 RepID=A0A9R1EW18_WHEAT|nr:hypothetical protein CFC21_030948 [Triticum aestivum]
MAFFNGGSRALVEILTRFQSAERPMPVDHTFFEFGSVRYHVQASASDPENVYLSISTPSLSHEASPSTGLPEFTLQEATKMYHKFAEVVEPSKEGYALTLKLNFSGLARPKDRARAVRQVSLLQSVILGSQLKHLLGSLGSSGATKLVYNHRDPFFVSRTVPGEDKRHLPHAFPGRHGPGRRHLLLPGAAGRRELVREGAQVQLVGHPAAGAARGARAPPHHQRRLRLLRYVALLPLVSPGVGVFRRAGCHVRADIFERHVKRKRAAKTAWILLNFQAYVKYHIKCTRNYIQSRMRKRQETLAEVRTSLPPSLCQSKKCTCKNQ